MKGCVCVKKIVRAIAVMLIFAVLASVCVMPWTGAIEVKAEVFSGELVSEHKAIDHNVHSHALVLTGSSEGQSATTPASVCGDYSMKFGFPKTEAGEALKAVRFTFASADGRSFAVFYSQTTEFTGFYVEVEEEKAGIYYGPKVLTYTSEKNAQGQFTTVAGEGDLGLRFDVDTMSVYASCGEEERLIWCFSKLYNDGKTLNTLLDPFTTYSVNVCFESIEYGKTAEMYLFAVNNQAFTDSKLVDNAAPSIYAFADTMPVLNTAYEIPVPGVYDPVDSGISENDVKVEIVSPVGKKTSLDYKKGLVYTFEQSGDYIVTYTVEDSSSHSATCSFVLRPIRPGDVTIDFSYDFAVPSNEIGVGATVQLPNATVATNRSNRLNAVQADIAVSIDGQSVQINNNKFITEKAGTYTVVYTAEYETATFTEKHIINAKDGLAVLSDVTFEDSYAYNETITIPDAVITVGGVDHKATKIITTPSGIAYSNKTILLDEAGEYTVSYGVVVNGNSHFFEKTFKVVKTGADLFVDVNGKSTIENGYVHFYEEATGVLLSMTEGAEVWYTNTIDLSNSTKSDYFVTYYIVPNTIGAADFGALRFFLVDKYDENNYIEILSKDSGAVNTGGVGSYNQAGCCGQAIGHGHETSATMNTNSKSDSGMTTLAGFRGTPFHTHTKAVLEGGFSLDYQTKQLFPKTSYAFSVAGSHTSVYQLTDLDNPNFFTEPWEGFTTGECYLKIVPEQVGSRANVVITSIGGISLASTTSATSYAPTVQLDEYEYGVPVGIVGMEYSIPAYKAVSKFYGNVQSNCHVYYTENGMYNEMTISNGAFVPDRAGDYVIVITAENPDGISVSKTYSLNVVESIDEFKITLDTSDDLLNGQIDSSATIAGYSLVGHTGNPEVTVSAISPDGTETQIVDCFTPDSAGTWTIQYTAVDYLNRTATTSYEVVVTVPEELMVATNPAIPSGFVHGYTYYIPNASAWDYLQNEGEPVKVDAAIYVTDASGRNQLPADGRYIANVEKHGDAIQIEYVFQGANNRTRTEKYDAVGLITTQNNELIIPNFFVSDGIQNVEATEEYTEFTFSTDASLSFSRPLLADGLKTVFNVNPKFNNFETIRVTLIDSVNADETITFTINKKSSNDTNSSFSLNNGISKNTTGSFFGNTPDIFMYSYSGITNSISDGSGSAIANVSTTVSGATFTGFTSGKVYIRFEFEGVTGQSKFMLNSISGQAISNASTDRVAPSVLVNNSISGIHQMNSVVTVSDIIAQDVLSEIEAATVTVTCGEQVILEECSAFETHDLSLSVYGRYFITYKVKDTAGRVYTVEDMLYVRGVADPSVTADAKIADSASVGDTWTLPTATVTDGAGDTNYYILILTPNGILYRLENNEVTFDYAGEWVIRYFAYDAYYNCTYADYQVLVK